MKSAGTNDVGGLIDPSVIWERVREVGAAALASGTLQAIETVSTTMRDGGIDFVVREVSSLLAKFAAQSRSAPRRNPFLPYEEALFVGHLTSGHVAILNKFPVMAEHLLVITRAFQPQDALLDADDFVALSRAMADRDCLAFFNGGRIAGASQPHRHLQLVPLPFEGAGDGTPIDAALASGTSGLDVADLGYRHAIGWMPESVSIDERGHAFHRLYRQHLDLLGIGEVQGDDGARQSQAYNLIATRRWLITIPRTREHVETISINALGFAGSLFVRNDTERALVVRLGPRGVLDRVTR